MLKKVLKELRVIVKITNNYVIVNVPEIHLVISAGVLTPISDEKSGATALSIGSAVMKAFSELARRVEGDSFSDENLCHKKTTEPLISIGKVSSMLGISVSSVRRLTSSGFLPSIVTQGKHRRYSKEVVEKLAQANQLVLFRNGTL